MDFQTLLCLCTDIVHFLFSTLHLLLTRILPLIAMLLGSLLLELLRFSASFLFRRPGFSIKALFLRRNRATVQQGQSETAMAQYDSTPSAPSYRDALQDLYEERASAIDQEEAIYGWAPSAPPYRDALQDHLDEDGASATQEEAIFSDAGDARLQEEEHFEDCFDADFIEEQQLLLSQYEDMKRKERTPAINEDRHETAANGDRQAVQAPRSMESQPSLFPSDLPATLDGVVQAAAAAEDDAARSGQTSSSAQKPLPPTLSNVQKALHDMGSSAEAEESSHGYSDAATSFWQARRGPVVPLNAPARTASYDKFFSKFTQHFKLDRN